MARRSEHSQDEIKSMILQTAEAIVAEQGFAELKVRNIAMEIGYTVGSIYMVFDNLADLIIHLKARTLDDFIAHLQQVSTQGPANKYLINLALAYLSFAQLHFNRWCMVFEPHSGKDSQFPDWYHEKLEQLFTPIENELRSLALPVIVNDLRSPALAFLGGIHGICSLFIPLYQNRAGPVDLEVLVVLLAENFIQGWLIEITQTTEDQ